MKVIYVSHKIIFANKVIRLKQNSKFTTVFLFYWQPVDCVKNVRASKNATEQTILGRSTSSAHVRVTTLTSFLRHNSQHLLPLTLVGLDLLQPGFDFVGEEGEEEWGGEFEFGCGVVVFVERDCRKTKAMLSNAARSHKVVNFRNAFWLVRNDMNTEYVVQDM